LLWLFLDTWREKDDQTQVRKSDVGRREAVAFPEGILVVV
jgi:hypothetical protein